MVWARFDDQFTDHPKVDALSDGAFRLHASAVVFAARNLTDGFVPMERIPRLVPHYKRSQLTEVVDAEMWHTDGKPCSDCTKGEEAQLPDGEGVYLHDFLEFHPTKAKVLAERAAAAQRQRSRRESHRDNQRDLGRESHPPRPDPARRATGRVSEEHLASDPPTPDAFGGVGSLPPEVVQRNVEQARAARQSLRAVPAEEAS